MDEHPISKIVNMINASFVSPLRELVHGHIRHTKHELKNLRRSLKLGSKVETVKRKQMQAKLDSRIDEMEQRIKHLQMQVNLQDVKIIRMQQENNSLRRLLRSETRILRNETENINPNVLQTFRY